MLRITYKPISFFINTQKYAVTYENLSSGADIGPRVVPNGKGGNTSSKPLRILRGCPNNVGIPAPGMRPAGPALAPMWGG
jgi:hypothetical protein